MYRYSIIYIPICGNFTRCCEYVMASSKKQAILKFYGTEAGFYIQPSDCEVVK